MSRKSVTTITHNLILENINENSVIVDATCGNGHDTAFLAKHSKHVHAFDIQQEAIFNARELTKDFNNITFHHISFEFITEQITQFDGVVFNLGYLPGSDKTIKTTYLTTIKALDKLHLRKQGFIVITAYTGHTEGFIESVAIQSWLDKHKINYRVLRLPHVTKHEAPFTFFWKY